MASKIWGTDCGFVKVIGNKIQKVLTPDGKSESKLYKDLLEHIKALPEEDLDYLKDQYRSWEGEYIHSVDDLKHLSLAIYGQTQSENFINSYTGPKDENAEPTLKETLQLLSLEVKVDSLLQKEGTEGSKISPETQKRYEEFIERSGFTTSDLSEGLVDKDGNKLKANAITDFIHKLVLVSKGQEAAIGEEASHIAVRMVKVKDPVLFKKMMNEIGKYNLYEQVVGQYGKDSNYILPDGKPNISKLKEEAIGKVFNELVINRLEGTNEKPELLVKAQDWWDKVKNFFKVLIGKLGFDPSEDVIDKAAKQFTNGSENFKDITPALSNLTDRKAGEDFEWFKDRTINAFEESAAALPDKSAIVMHGSAINLLKTWKDDGYKSFTHLGAHTKEEDFAKKITENTEIVPMAYQDKTIYLVRHGESEGNKAGIDNTTTTPLTTKGEQQAKEVANSLKDLGVTNIISTNTTRTQATASIIAKEIGITDIFTQQSNPTPQDIISEKLEEDNGLVKKEEGSGDSFYEIHGKKIANRVTQFAKKYLENIFKNKPWFKDKIDELIQDQKKQLGVGGHKDIENILERGIDKTTGLRKEDRNGQYRLDSKDSNYTPAIDPKDEGYYYSLQKYLFGEDTDAGHTPGLLDDTIIFPKGTKFYWEKKVYDPKRDLAGTIDFMSVTPEGKVHMFDWKFIGSLEKNQAIRDYMKKSYDIQMENYKDILEKNYGVKEFGQSRIIPISVKYSEKKGEEGNYVSLRIGSVDYKSVSEKDYYLLPYTTTSEKSSDKNINNLVQRLTGLIDQIRNKPGNKEDNIIKQNKIHNIERALLFIRLSNSFQPYLEQVKVFNKEGHKNLQSLLDKFSTITFDELKYADASTLLEPINEILDDLSIYQDIGDFNVYFDKTTTEGLEMAKDLLAQQENARALLKKAEEVHAKYFSALFKNKTPQEIIDPQKKLETLGAWGRPLSKSQLTTSQAFYKVNDYRQHIVEYQSNDMLHMVESIGKGLKEWGTKRGLTGGSAVLKSYTDLLEKKDSKGQGVNRLISQFDAKFYEELTKRTSTKEPSSEDVKWIKNNIDQSAFKAWADNYKITRYQEIKDLIMPGKEEEVEQKKEAMRNHVDKITDYSKDYAWTQVLNVKRFARTDLWHSKEYKEILKPENLEVKALYDFILETNELATKHGYIESKLKKTLLPWIDKSLAEKVVLGGKWKVLDKILESVSTIKGDGDSEKLDPISGKLIPQLQKFFTHDISEIDADGHRDYSMVSDEMLKNAAIFRYKVLDYNAKKETEELIQGLIHLENYKGMLESTTKGRLTGRVVKNIENAETLEKQIKQMFYNQSILTTVDLKGKVITVAGKEREVSGIKALNTIKAVYSLDVLGFNAVTSIFRTITTNLAGLYTANQYYTSKQMLEGLWDFTAMRTFKNDHKLTIGLLKDFLPVEENLQEGLNELSSTKASAVDFQGVLMKWVKSAHNIVQYSNFLAHMKNAIIVDGKLINAREYYRNSVEFKDRYNKSASERKKLEGEFDGKIKELTDKYGLLNKATFNEQTGRVDYEGLDFNDFSVADMKSTIRVMGRKLSGNISENDESLMRSNAIVRQMFLFTNWLPQAVDIRFGNLAYNEGIDSYEWGRIRMMGRVLFGEGLLPKIGKLIDMTKANEKGIEHLHQLYITKAQEYKEQTGLDLKMTPEEFYDLFRQNMKIQGREMLSLLTMASLAMGAAALLPKKDEDPDHQGYFTFMKRVLNRCQDELEIFYNPTSFTKFADSSKFPMLSYLTTTERAIKSILAEVYGYTVDDKKLIDNSHVIKHTFGALPVFKEGLEVINILDPEMGTYLGMHYTSEMMGKK